MIVPLFDAGNATTQSAVFKVEVGKAIALFAVGLERYKVRQDSRTMQDLQRICVNRILQEYNPESYTMVEVPGDLCDCRFVLMPSWGKAVTIVEETVTSDGCPWQLTSCNNFRIVVVPGLYRLHLNDDTAIGKVQVYAEEFDLANLPQQAAGLFFG